MVSFENVFVFFHNERRYPLLLWFLSFECFGLIVELNTRVWHQFKLKILKSCDHFGECDQK